MNIFSYISFIALILYIHLGLYIFWLDGKSRLNLAFVLMCLSLSIKSFFSIFSYNAADKASCLMWYNFADIGWNLFPAAALVFFITLIDEEKYLLNKKNVFLLLFSPWLIFLYQSASGKLDNAVSIERNSGGWHIISVTSPNATDLYFVLYSLICIYFLGKWARQTHSRREKKQAGILLVSTVLTFLAGSVTDIIMPLMGYNFLPMLAHIITLIWFIGVWWAVTRYKFMNLTTAILSDEIISRIMDFVIITDEKFTIKYSNNRIYELTGFRPSEIAGSNVWEYIRECNFPLKAPEIFKNGTGKITLAASLSSAGKGENIPVNITISAVCDEWNDLSGHMICGSDVRATRQLEHEIDERKKYAAVVIAEREKYLQLANLLPQPIFETDMSGKLTFVNEAAYAFFKYSKEEFENGLYIFQMVQASEVERVKRTIKELADPNRPPLKADIQYVMKRKDGSTFYAMIHSIIITSEGKTAGLRGMIIDITELKNARERLKQANDELEMKVRERTAELAFTNEKLNNEIIARRKMEAEMLKVSKLESIGILAGGIAHDFNNLLMGILGNITLVQKKMNENDPNLEILKRAEDVAFKAKNLTWQLLSFSKDSRPLTKPVKIDALIKDAAIFTLRGSNIECEFSFDAGLNPIQIDESQINQVFTNLIINAMQAMPFGGKIRFFAESIIVNENSYLPIKTGEYVKITVSDTGNGIAQQELLKIFDPYYTTKPKGSGLGLTSAFSIIRNHEGLITVESLPGKGTSFYIYLPYSSQDKVLITQKTEVEEKMVSFSGRALLMDDEEPIRSAIGEILACLGFKVDCCKDGLEAIELYSKSMAQSQKYDILIIDLTVPGGMGGVEAMEKLIKMDPDACAIASSGYYSGSVRNDYAALGFRAFLPKPYKIEDLYKTIKKIMR